MFLHTQSPDLDPIQELLDEQEEMETHQTKPSPPASSPSSVDLYSPLVASWHVFLSQTLQYTNHITVKHCIIGPGNTPWSNCVGFLSTAVQVMKKQKPNVHIWVPVVSWPCDFTCFRLLVWSRPLLRSPLHSPVCTPTLICTADSYWLRVYLFLTPSTIILAERCKSPREASLTS